MHTKIDNLYLVYLSNFNLIFNLLVHFYKFKPILVFYII